MPGCTTWCDAPAAAAAAMHPAAAHAASRPEPPLLLSLDCTLPIGPCRAMKPSEKRSYKAVWIQLQRQMYRGQRGNMWGSVHVRRGLQSRGKVPGEVAQRGLYGTGLTACPQTGFG